MCVACDKRFNLTSGLESARHEYHHKVRLQCSLESKSKQGSCVWPVTRDSIWHLDLKAQDMNITTKSDCKVVLNQRANRIHACGLWPEVQFDMNSSEKKTTVMGHMFLWIGSNLTPCLWFLVIFVITKKKLKIWGTPHHSGRPFPGPIFLHYPH